MKKIKYSLVLAVIGLAVFSCKKSGCTDPEATNADLKARSNNLLCEYSSSLIVWYNKAGSTEIKDSGGTGATERLFYYVDNVLLDSMKVDGKGVENEPTCGTQKLYTLNNELGLSDFKYIKLKVQGDKGHIFLDSILMLSANECNKIQLLKKE